ncbi:hypothetical protein BaRGS_00025374 [Batillaria attramentaria]|uniref:Uncharacterized protein n=1 Tax=Batillaria attramentaria TaxID=370345 RepID=A0ABD0K8M5_9CAEN
MYPVGCSSSVHSDSERWKMSGKVKVPRSSANPSDTATQSLNERILKECHLLYIDPENGIRFIWRFMICFTRNPAMLKSVCNKPIADDDDSADG